METKIALATRNELNQIAQIDPTTAWLYQGGNRISIDNKHRDGFVFKETEEKVTTLTAAILSIKPSNSHRQPEEKEKRNGAPSHALNADWCESFTNRKDAKCSDCTAYDACAWKMELSLTIPNQDGEFLMTIPTVSSMRFKDVSQLLAKNAKRHFSQVMWQMTVHVEESNGNSYPVVDFAPFDMQTGAQLIGSSKASTNPSTKSEQLSQLGAIRKLIHDANGTMPAKDTLVWSTEAEFAEILAVHKALLETALSENMP